jgi:preprotein translocase subunit SecA
VLTEWHESARIDRQLVGRCARQGEPGSCRAIVCLDDEVIQRHGSALVPWIKRKWAAQLATGEVPSWAIELLRRSVQFSAERINEAQRRATIVSDREMRKQLAFSGTFE